MIIYPHLSIDQTIQFFKPLMRSRVHESGWRENSFEIRPCKMKTLKCSKYKERITRSYTNFGTLIRLQNIFFELKLHQATIWIKNSFLFFIKISFLTINKTKKNKRKTNFFCVTCVSISQILLLTSDCYWVISSHLELDWIVGHLKLDGNRDDHHHWRQSIKLRSGPSHLYVHVHTHTHTHMKERGS